MATMDDDAIADAFLVEVRPYSVPVILAEYTNAKSDVIEEIIARALAAR